ncbi:MAG: hypothetical protein GY723_22200 [bacterium]|nr:hypothetical protein [bacterium]
MHIQPPAHDHAHQLGSLREQQDVERTQRGCTHQSRDTEHAHRGRTEHARGAEGARRGHAGHAGRAEGAHRGRCEHAERERLERAGPPEWMRIEGQNQSGRSVEHARQELHDVAHEVRHEVRSFLNENPELDDETRHALRSATRDLHEDIRGVMHELRHGGFEDRTELADTVRGVFETFLSGLREIQASLEAPAAATSQAPVDGTSQTSADATSEAAAVDTASEAEPTVSVADPELPAAEETPAIAMASLFEGFVAQFQQQMDRFEGLLQQVLNHASEDHEETDDDPATALEARIEASASIFARYTADHFGALGNRVDSAA